MNARNAFKKALFYLEDSRDRQRIAIALAKAAATRMARRLDLTDPRTWEFTAFSQNGEDGVLDVLRGQLLRPNRCCVEIGSGDGVENNTAWLLVAEGYCGLMVEGDTRLARRTSRNVTTFSIGSECRNLFVEADTVAGVLATAPCAYPDVFSLDIDGNDYHIMKAALATGFRPQIIVVEYNSVFGAERSVTIPYQPTFRLDRSHPTRLWYGVSVCGWRTLLESEGYRFVTVEQNGVNAFFADPGAFPAGFLDTVLGQPFAENRYQLRKFGFPSGKQFELIAKQPLLGI